MAKHAGARTVVVDVRRGTGRLTITVTDDGRGVREADLRARAGHIGVSSMRDRAAAAGGQLHLGRTLEGGTEVQLTLPT